MFFRVVHGPGQGQGQGDEILDLLGVHAPLDQIACHLQGILQLGVALQNEIDRLKHERNVVSKEIAGMKGDKINADKK